MQGKKMQNLILRWLLTAGLAIAAAGCQSGAKDPVVAQVGDYRITASQLKAALKKAFPDKSLSDIPLEDRQQTLEDMLDIFRKAVWARQNGLDQDSVYQSEVQRFADQKVAMALVSERVTSALIPEDLLRQYYDWYFTDVEAVIVKVGHKEASVRKDRTLEEALETAVRFKKMLKFANHPVKTAKNLTEANPAGVLAKPYQIGRIPMPGDSLIFNTPVGEVGGPVQTSDGLVLVRVLAKQTRPKDRGFAAVKTEILQILRRQIRDEELKLFERISEALREKYQAKVNDDGVNRVAEVVAEWANRSRMRITELVHSERNIVLGEVNGTPVYSGQFFDNFRTMLLQNPAAITPATIKERFVEQEIDLRCWVLEGRAAGLDQTPQFRRELQEYSARQLAGLVNRRETEKEDEVSEAEARVFYEENQDRYIRPERIAVWQIVVKDEKTAREILRKARAGEDFAALHKKYVGQRSGGAARFRLGFLPRNANLKEVAAAAFAAGPNQITGPVKINDHFYVIKTGKHEPEAVRPFDQVRNSVINEVKTRRQEARLQKLSEEIRSQVAATVNESVLKTLS